MVRPSFLGSATWLLSVGLLGVPAARGDALMVNRSAKAPTIAEIFVEPGEVRVELEIGLEDLQAFRNLLPDEVLEKIEPGAPPLGERFKDFFTEDWVLVSDGLTLVPRVKSIEGRPRNRRDEITGAILAPETGDEVEPVIAVSLEYALEPERPAILALTPPGRRGDRPPASIGFVLYHQGLAVNDFRYLGIEATVDLDWKDSWYSRFRHPNLKRQFDAPLRGFLYAEPFEVRKEILARPRDLETWIDLDLEGKTVLTPADQEAILAEVGAFLEDRCPVTIDGKPAQGSLDRIHFVRRTLRQTSVVGPGESVPVVSATIGAIFVYPTTGLPREATMTWDLFTERTPRMVGMATDEAGGLPLTVTPDDPGLTWKNYLKNPTVPGLVDLPKPADSKAWRIPITAVLALGLGLAILVRRPHGSGRGNPVLPWGIVAVLAGLAFVPATWITLPFGHGGADGTAGETGPLVEGLLSNIYRAFDFRTESEIYDALDQSVEGALLTDVYLEVQRALQLESQGGAQTKVKEVEVIGTTPLPSESRDGFSTQVEWTVLGTVGHWGHLHQRRNRYRADLTIEPIEGAWKLTGLELREEERL